MPVITDWKEVMVLYSAGVNPSSVAREAVLGTIALRENDLYTQEDYDLLLEECRMAAYDSEMIMP